MRCLMGWAQVFSSVRIQLHMKNVITSQQIAEAMKAFAGTVHHLPPEVALRRSSVGFRSNQMAFEEVSGISTVRVEVLPAGDEEGERA